MQFLKNEQTNSVCFPKLVIMNSGWCTLDGCRYFLVGSGWLLLFLDGLWMVAVISWWTLDGCCCCLVNSGWLLLFTGGNHPESTKK